MKRTTTEWLKLIAAIIVALALSIASITADSTSSGYSLGTFHFIGWLGLIISILAAISAILQARGVGPIIKSKNRLPLPQPDCCGGLCLIRVAGTDAAALERTIDAFIELYGKEDRPPRRPSLQRSADSLLLIFPEAGGKADIDFEIFCYWVNFICWETDGGKRNVVGWFETGAIKPDATDAVLGSRTLMVFVADDDTAGDNVCITTADDTCCLHSFSGVSSLKLISPSPRQYEPMPSLPTA